MSAQWESNLRRILSPEEVRLLDRQAQIELLEAIHGEIKGTKRQLDHYCKHCRHLLPDCICVRVPESWLAFACSFMAAALVVVLLMHFWGPR